MEGKNVYVIVGTDGYPIPYIADDFDDAIGQHRVALATEFVTPKEQTWE